MEKVKVGSYAKTMQECESGMLALGGLHGLFEMFTTKAPLFGGAFVDKLSFVLQHGFYLIEDIFGSKSKFFIEYIVWGGETK